MTDTIPISKSTFAKYPAESSTSFLVSAFRKKKFDARHEKRVRDIFERVGIDITRVLWIQGREDGSDASDVDLEFVVDGWDKTIKIVSELRACGFVVGKSVWAWGSGG